MFEHYRPTLGSPCQTENRKGKRASRQKLVMKAPARKSEAPDAYLAAVAPGAYHCSISGTADKRQYFPGELMFFSYDALLRGDVEAALSGDRLSVYRAAAGAGLNGAIDLYCWNVALGSAFFGPIGVLEVVLRNALDRELSHAFSSPWYDDRAFLASDPKVEARIAAAKDEITKRRHALTHPRMVAQLSFGFWVNLLRPGPNGAYVPALWGPALSKAFPAGTKRSRVVAELDPLLKFRNRVAHHEPIFRSDPVAQYESILRIIALVAPSLVPWVEHHSRVRTLIAQGPYPPRSLF